jgi:hypothetical protein
MEMTPVQVASEFSFGMADLPSNLPGCYRSFLESCNGGYTAGCYFHFFGLTGPVHHNVILWNRSEWRTWYSLDASWFIFAEDILGSQYYVKTKGRTGSVYMLDCNSGKTYFMADTYDRFIRNVVEDPAETVIGESKRIAAEFFHASGCKWKPFLHLSCRVPSLLGGSETDVSNIELCDSITNLTILGQLVSQTRNLKPGTIIKDVQIDYQKREIRLIY